MKPELNLLAAVRLKCCAILWICLTVFSTNAIAGADEPLFIPDDNSGGVISYRNISNDGFISAARSIEVTCAINHSWVGDLKIVLISPSGTAIVLAEGIGKSSFSDGCPSDNLQVTFSADGMPMDNIVCAFSESANDRDITQTGSAVTSGKYLPKTPFNRLFGQPVSGKWALQIIDAAAGNKGWLLDWDISVGAQISMPVIQDTHHETFVKAKDAYELFNCIQVKEKKQILIPFCIPDMMDVVLEIFDARGNKIYAKNLLFLKGPQQFKIARKEIGKGTFYFYIKTKDQLLSKKMTIS